MSDLFLFIMGYIVIQTCLIYYPSLFIYISVHNLNPFHLEETTLFNTICKNLYIVIYFLFFIIFSLSNICHIHRDLQDPQLHIDIEIVPPMKDGRVTPDLVPVLVRGESGPHVVEIGFAKATK